MDMDGLVFRSPTHGRLELNELAGKLRTFITHHGDGRYRLMVGTDSKPHGNNAVPLITAIALTKVGYGGIYFLYQARPRHFVTLRDRINAETRQSVWVADLLRSHPVVQELCTTIEIHLDVGSCGDTREMIRGMVAQVVGIGYQAATKPNAPAASSVANRHT